MEKPKSFPIYATFIAITLSAIIAVFLLIQIIQKREQEKRRLQLVNIHSSAKTQLRSNINQFAAIAAGLRTYTQKSEGIPDPDLFQSFLNEQLSELAFEGQYIISVIDSTHRFVYTFDANSVNSNGLSGTFIPQINDLDAISRLDSTMMDQEIHMSQPINLYEGWLGLSFSFSLYQNGIPIGYVTPILSVKEMLTSYYSDEISRQFSFSFRTNKGQYFDQHKIYDLNPTIISKTLSENYAEIKTPAEEMIESSLSVYGQTFIISTAFKERLSPVNLTSITITVGFVLFILAVGLIFSQVVRMKYLNTELLKNQALITSQSNALELRNTELNRLNKGKDLFFSIIGHDLKSPMATIHSMMDILAEKNIPEQDKQELYLRLKNATRNTIDLLDNVLNWALLNNDRLSVNKEQVSLIEISKEVVKSIESLAARKNIKVEVKTDDELIVYADKNMIQTSIRNLISNAVKFTPDDGNVTIIGEKSSSNISLYVCDTGIGISKEKLNTLFDVGHKDVSEDTDGNRSTGFGLILTKEFIEKNGGSIRVESIPDKGSTFEISFSNA